MHKYNWQTFLRIQRGSCATSILILATEIQLELANSSVGLRKIEKKRNGEERKTMDEEG